MKEDTWVTVSSVSTSRFKRVFLISSREAAAFACFWVSLIDLLIYFDWFIFIFNDLLIFSFSFHFIYFSFNSKGCKKRKEEREGKRD